MPVLPEREKEAFPERTFVVEAGKIHETPAEKEGLVERVWEAELEKPITDGKGKVLVTSPAAQKPRIVLPVSQSSYLNPANWHKPVVYAIRWLLLWAQRIVKMYPQRVIFRKP